VLIVMLIGFTVMQHAFAGGGATNGIVSDVERRALALTGSGDLIWDWDVSADKVFTSPETEALLGLKRGTLEGPAARWLEVLHPLDQRSLPRGARQRARAAPRPPRAGLPPAHPRRSLHWFALKARPVVGSDGEGVTRGRHPHRRHRDEECRGAHAARRGARQPHRPAEPQAVH
jgi:PAS domain-containing protein